jgi:hypothetical protein
MFQGPVFPLPDECRSGQECGQARDLIDDLGNPREAVLVEVRVVLRPDDKLHIGLGGPSTSLADPTTARWSVREPLTRWQKEPDLACVRDRAELDKLPADERIEYLAL